MCEYCEPDEAGNLKLLREEPDDRAWLEEYGGEWGIVASVTTQSCSRECTTEFYVRVRNCPMCGRKLEGEL